MIPSGLRIPLSFLGTEKQVQFPETEATDLDLRLCVSERDSSATISPSDTSRLWVLPRLINLGVKFSRKKLGALLRGDQSGIMLDPAFVCGSHVLGMLFSRDVNDTPAMVRFHAIRAQIAWERLVELFDPDCEPPSLFSLALLEDGTTGDSKYPNLMSPEARVPYGI